MAPGLLFESLSQGPEAAVQHMQSVPCVPSYLQPHSSSAVLAHGLTWWFGWLEKGETCSDTEGSARPPVHPQQSNNCLVIIKNANKSKNPKLQAM